MSEELKANIRLLVEEVWNKGNLAALDEFFIDDFVQHRPPFPDIEGLEAFKQQIADTRNAYPDFQITLDEIIIEGDTVVTRWTWRGTHTGQGTLLPIPPTDKQVLGTGCTVTHLREGKSVEEWFYADNLGLLQQLGVVPPLEQGEQ